MDNVFIRAIRGPEDILNGVQSDVSRRAPRATLPCEGDFMLQEPAAMSSHKCQAPQEKALSPNWCMQYTVDCRLRCL